MPAAMACIKKRALISIGNIKTSLTVSKVNTCKNKIENIILETELNVNYKNSLIRGPNLPKYIKEKGIKVIKKLLSLANKQSVHNVIAISFGAINFAKNNKSFIKIIENETDIKIIPITKEQEAVLNLLSIKTFLKLPAKNIAIWDIDEDSMSFATAIEKGEFKVITRNIGSNTFSDSIKKLKYESNIKSKKNIKSQPIEKSAQVVASLLAKNKIPLAFNNYLKNKTIFSIGEIHSETQKFIITKKQFYTQEDYLKSINKEVKLKGQQSLGSFSSANITNLILTLGFMEALDIKKILPASKNSSYSALLSPELWEN